MAFQIPWKTYLTYSGVFLLFYYLLFLPWYGFIPGFIRTLRRPHRHLVRWKKSRQQAAENLLQEPATETPPTLPVKAPPVNTPEANTPPVNTPTPDTEQFLNEAENLLRLAAAREFSEDKFLKFVTMQLLPYLTAESPSLKKLQKTMVFYGALAYGIDVKRKDIDDAFTGWKSPPEVSRRDPPGERTSGTTSISQ